MDPVHVPRNQAEELAIFGVKFTVAVPAALTDGAFSVFEEITPPRLGPPLHIHHAEDETFVMLSGECEFWLEGETCIKGPGETVFVPRGSEHAFRVIGTAPSRHLVILTPGGFEHFFEEMAAGQCRIPEDMAKVEESAARHNLRFTGPPLAADEVEA